MKNYLRLLLLALSMTGASSAFATLVLNNSCGLIQEPLAFQKTPCNTKYAVGPFTAQTIWGAALVLPPGTLVLPPGSTLPSVLPSGSYAAIYNGFDAWNGSTLNTVGRLTGWNGTFSTSDCPVGKPFQVGMMNFFAPGEGGSCAAVTAQNLHNLPAIALDIPLAFSDYDSTRCTGCGTKSVTVNLAVAWSTDGAPLIGQRDLRSVMAHEFGHVLGMGHHFSGDGTCGNSNSPTCLAVPTRSTMDNYFYPRSEPDTNTNPDKFETCGRSLGYYDILRANQLYPVPVGGFCQ